MPLKIYLHPCIYLQYCLYLLLYHYKCKGCPMQDSTDDEHIKKVHFVNQDLDTYLL